jgi:hypothetical protein
MKTAWDIMNNVHNSDHMPPSLKTDNAEVLPHKAAGAFSNIF